MRATCDNNINIVITLLEAKADPNITEEVDSITCSHCLYNSNLIMLQDGMGALSWAAFKGHIDIIKLLVKHGGAVDIRDKVIS